MASWGSDFILVYWDLNSMTQSRGHGRRQAVKANPSPSGDGADIFCCRDPFSDAGDILVGRCRWSSDICQTNLQKCTARSSFAGFAFPAVPSEARFQIKYSTRIPHPRPRLFSISIHQGLDGHFLQAEVGKTTLFPTLPQLLFCVSAQSAARTTVQWG